MPKDGVQVNTLFPEGIIKEIEEIIRKDRKWLSTQDFIRYAVAEKIERWKKENAVG